MASYKSTWKEESCLLCLAVSHKDRVSIIGHSCHQCSYPREALGRREPTGKAGAEESQKRGQPQPPIHTALACRMDSFEDKLQQLREAFKAGRTQPAEFRAAQLQGLGRFLRDNKQQLQEALAQDLHKVVSNRDSGVGGVPPDQQGWCSWDKEHCSGIPFRQRS